MPPFLPFLIQMNFFDAVEIQSSSRSLFNTLITILADHASVIFIS